MRRIRSALAFLVAAVAVTALEAQPQPRPATIVTPAPLAVALLNGIDDPIVVAELKLKDEQVKSLVARRTELWDEAYITSPNKLAEKAEARNKATDELLKKTLTADQYKRATQLAAQGLLMSPRFGPDEEPALRLTAVSGVTLQRYPELATAFKITGEQKKQLEAPGVTKGGKTVARMIRMSKEQEEAAKQFVGPLVKSYQAKFDPRAAGVPVAPASFTLLEAKDVRADLKLADAEAKAVAALAAKWQKLAADRFTDLSPKEVAAQSKELRTETEQELAALKPEQLARLKQIEFQNGGRGFGPGGGGFGPGGPRGTVNAHIETMYGQERVGKALELTDDQREQFQAVRAAFNKDAAAVLAAADAAEPAQKKLDDLVAGRRKKAEAVLTAAQATKWSELAGAPFTGSVAPDRIGGAGFLDPETVASMRAASFSKHSLVELNLLSANKGVQEELKMDDKQVKKAVEARDRIPNRFPGAPGSPEAAKLLDERSKQVADELSKLLNEDQAKRFQQLMLQYWETRTAPPPGAISTVIPSAVVYPGVAEALKLTDDQKKKLLAGDAPADVLSDVQKSAIKEMLGMPFKGELTSPFFGPRSPFPQPTATVRVFQSGADVLDDLKLDDEQKRKFAAAAEGFQKAMAEARPVGGIGVNFDEYAAAMKTAYEAYDGALAEILTDAQKARLGQLAIQVDAANDLLTAFTSAEVAKKLALTKDQTEKVTALEAESAKLYTLRATHMPVAFNAEDDLGPKMRDRADDRLMGVLTDGQKKAWKDLTGEPLKGLRKTIPFGGGGFGGPGGFGP